MSKASPPTGSGPFAWRRLRSLIAATAAEAKHGMRRAEWLLAGAKAPPGDHPHASLAGRWEKGGSKPWTSLGIHFPEDLSTLRMAIICDAFTTLQLSMEWAVCILRPSTWKQQMDDFAPHLLFTESAWRGVDGEWAGAVTGNGAALTELLGYCRERGIPSLFWAKEDPIHYEDFIGTASAFDFVFTTDLDCIPFYKRDLAHERVHLLPFAVQPRLHHPVAMAGEKKVAGAFFAGAWYGGFHQRCRDFTMLADALAQAGTLDIYDRLSADAQTGYPERYRSWVRGGIPYAQTPALYRKYRIGMTVNTVTDSPTMFARRAVELMACGTSVYSNRCRALEHLFGDLVGCFDSTGEVLDAAKGDLAPIPLLADRRKRNAAVRKVVREFSWDHRIRWMIATVSGRPDVRRPSEIAVLTRVDDQQQLEMVRAMASAQRGVRVRLFVDAGSEALAGDGLVPLTERMQELRVRELCGKTALVAPWHPDDTYGPQYLADLLDGMSFGLGAATCMRGSGSTQADGGAGFELVGASDLRTSLFRADAWEGNVGDLLSGLGAGALLAPGTVSMEADSYVRDGNLSGARASETSFLPQGVSLDELLAAPTAGPALMPPPRAWVSPETVAWYFRGGRIPAGASVSVRNQRLELVGTQESARGAEIASIPVPRHLLEREGRLRISLIPGPQVVEAIRLVAINRWGKILEVFEVGKAPWPSGVAVDGRAAAYRIVIPSRRWSVEYFDGFLVDTSIDDGKAIDGAW